MTYLCPHLHRPHLAQSAARICSAFSDAWHFGSVRSRCLTAPMPRRLHALAPNLSDTTRTRTGRSIAAGVIGWGGMVPSHQSQRAGSYSSRHDMSNRAAENYQINFHKMRSFARCAA